MKIIVKLFVTFFVLTIITGIIGYVGISSINQISDSFDIIAEETAPELIILGDISSLSHELQLEAISIVLLESMFTDENILQEEYDEYEKISVELDEAIENLEEHGHEEEEGFFETMKELEEDMHAAASNLIKNSKGADQQTILALKEELEHAEHEMHDFLEDRINQEIKEFEMQDATSDKLSIDTINFVLIASGSAMITALVL